jgi:hypothetical protein
MLIVSFDILLLMSSTLGIVLMRRFGKVRGFNADTFDH